MADWHKRLRWPLLTHLDRVTGKKKWKCKSWLKTFVNRHFVLFFSIPFLTAPIQTFFKKEPPTDVQMFDGILVHFSSVRPATTFQPSYQKVKGERVVSAFSCLCWSPYLTMKQSLHDSAPGLLRQCCSPYLTLLPSLLDFVTARIWLCYGPYLTLLQPLPNIAIHTWLDCSPYTTILQPKTSHVEVPTWPRVVTQSQIQFWTDSENSISALFWVDSPSN